MLTDARRAQLSNANAPTPGIEWGGGGGAMSVVVVVVGSGGSGGSGVFIPLAPPHGVGRHVRRSKRIPSCLAAIGEATPLGVCVGVLTVNGARDVHGTKRRARVERLVPVDEPCKFVGVGQADLARAGLAGSLASVRAGGVGLA